MKHPISFKLVKINTEQFASIGDVPKEEDARQLEVGFGFGINRPYNRIRCQGKFQFMSAGSPFLVLQVSCEFEVKPEDWDVLTDEKKKRIQLPVDLIQHLGVITTGTARGVFHAKTENTDFNKFFLPAINLKEILTETISLEML